MIFKVSALCCPKINSYLPGILKQSLKVFLICAVTIFFLSNQTAFAQRDTTITLKVLGGLQFELPRFAVRPNTKVTVILDNHDDMAHNVVFTKPNSRLKVVDEALKLGDKGAKMDYVPNSPLILAHTKILEPGRTESISFLIENEGIYPYVCTYPGHGYVMYGAMYATTKALPPLEKDLNVPEGQRLGTPNMANHSGHHMAPASPHPYPLEYPLLYRTFMPDCGPAAIAVALNPNESYCFDAGKCYLRYAWSGGFVDNTDHWKGNGNKLAKIVGSVYWKDETGFPFKAGKNQKIPTVHFKGYHLTKRLPAFRYMLDEISVSETVKLSAKGNGIIREFTFKNNPDVLFFTTGNPAGIKFTFSAGKYKNGVLEIPAGTARLTITSTRI